MPFQVVWTIKPTCQNITNFQQAGNLLAHADIRHPRPYEGMRLFQQLIPMLLVSPATANGCISNTSLGMQIPSSGVADTSPIVGRKHCL